MSVEDLHRSDQMTAMESTSSGPYRITLTLTQVDDQRRFDIHVEPTGEIGTGRALQETDALMLLGFESYPDCPITKGSCYSLKLSDYSADELHPEIYADQAKQRLLRLQEHFGGLIGLLTDAAQRAELCGLSFWEREF